MNYYCILFFTKLRIEIGDRKALMIIEELNTIRKLLEKLKGIFSVGDGYGLAFEVFAIAVQYRYTYEKVIENYIVHGSFDGKVDAVIWDSENVYVYQIKLGSISYADYLTMCNHYEDFRNHKKLPKEAKDLEQFLIQNRTQLEGKSVFYMAISSDFTFDFENQVSPFCIYQKYFENVFLPVSENHIELLIRLPKNSDGHFGYSVTPTQDYVFFITAEELIQDLFQCNNRTKNDLSLYCCDNVRGVLSENKEMVQTIMNEPENFVKYNNGISITGSVCNLNGQLKIINPVINNGQQTLHNLVLADCNWEKIYLTLTVKDSNQLDIKSKISRYTNDQVKIKLIDILSLNPYVRSLQKKILNQFILNSDEKEFYFLDIYSQGSKPYQNKLNVLCPRNHVIHLLDFIKLYFSMMNPNDLGYWKSTPSSQLQGVYDRIDQEFDFSLSKRVCSSIIEFENYLDQIHDKKLKADLSCADLALEFLVCYYQFKIESAVSIICQINLIIKRILLVS